MSTWQKPPINELKLRQRNAVLGDEVTEAVGGSCTGTPGYTPKRGTDYWTAEDIEAMRSENEAYIAEELAKRNQLEPLIAESAEWLNENGDPTKVYIVPNANGQGGKVYAYSEVKYNLEPDNVIGENPSRGENDVNVGVVTGRLSGSTGTVDPDYTNAKTTGFIECGDNDRITIENWRGYSYTSCYIVAYDTNQTYIGNVSLVWNEVTDGGFLTTSTQNKWADTSKTREEFEMTSYPLSSSNVINKTGIAYIRISSGKGVGSDYAIYVNKEQDGGTVTASKWYAFCDYIPTENARLDELEREIELLKAGSGSASDIRTWDKPVFDTAPVTLIEGDTKPSLTGRETVEALYAAYDGLPSRYVTRTPLGDDASGTIPIYRYDVTAPKPHEYSGGGNPAIVKPKVILISGIHYEWVGIWSLFHAIEEICTNPAFRDVLRNAHLIVVPACNPYCLDPNRYSETGGGRQNANGVEIHRNFAVDHEVISEDADNYGGASPLSEPETRYIDQILKENSDAAFFVSCHNFDGGGDTTYGTSFMWASTATNYLYTLGGRFGVKMSEAWEDKYGDVWRQNIDAHKTENQPDGDYTVGMAGKSTSPGTEAKQCMLYGIQGMTFEVGGSIIALGASTADAVTVTRGAEVYANLIRTLLEGYDPGDKREYGFWE